MADCYDDLMNLDLNLVPVTPGTPSVGSETEPLSEESIGLNRRRPCLHMVQRLRQALRLGSHQLPLEARLIDSNGNGGDPGVSYGGDVVNGSGSGTIQVGEGSVAAEERGGEVLKMCENNVISLKSVPMEGKEDVEKSSSESGSFFDCNICLELSREPVVTCCGHLFCWACIYRWLYIASDAKECPVCKGEVTLKNITPIYGRGNHTLEPEEDSGINIPPRPSPGGNESLRQTLRRTSHSLALSRMEEVIQRLGARVDPRPDIFQLLNVDGDSDSNSDSRAVILNRIMTTRARQREQDVFDSGSTRDSIPHRTVTLNDVVDLTQEAPEEVPRRLPPLSNIRGQSHRRGSVTSRAYIEACLLREDRDILSGIATVQNDLRVYLSASSSRRSELDSEDSRALRRRRLE